MALVLWAGDRLYLTSGPSSSAEEFALGSTPELVARAIESHFEEAIRRLVGKSRSTQELDELRVLDAPLRRGFESAGYSLQTAPVEQYRAARRSAFAGDHRRLRATALALAELRVRSRLAAPEEVLISLAREEERLERALRRETNASDQWLVAGPDLEAYDRERGRFRESLADHHARLEARVGELAHELVPNLAQLVGGRTAARLVAQAGGTIPLARMNSSRIQLLGSLRRPASDRTPRFGVLFRAEGMNRVPLDRRGAYARSLAALAAIAARADASTKADLSARLIQRRDRRIDALNRRLSP
ncbi:MAG: hypothetical protein WCA77_09850 [Thermoplasmata archaeon]